MRRRHQAFWLGGMIALAAAVAFPVMSHRTEQTKVAEALARGDAARAPDHMRRYGCGGCHTIRDVPGADGKVGPNLTDMRARVFVGGGLRNTGDNLIRFIVDPDPRTAMPKTGISEQEARDVVTFLYGP